MHGRISSPSLIHIALTAACLCPLGGTFAADDDRTADEFGTKQAIVAIVERVAAHSAEVVFNVFEEDDLSALLDGRAASPTAVASELRDVLANSSGADLRVFLFADREALQSLGDGELRRLRRELDRGKALIGARGSLQELKRALGLPLALEPRDESAVPLAALSSDDQSHSFLRRSTAGHLEEILLPLSTDGVVDEEVDRLLQWHHTRSRLEARPRPDLASDAETSGPLQESPAAWIALHHFNSQGGIEGLCFSSAEEVSEFEWLVDIYLANRDILAESEQTVDYYRIDTAIVSTILDYAKSQGSIGLCGWWTQTAELAVAGRAVARAATLEDFMPETTVNSTTRTFSIGGQITTSQAGVSFGFSQSYGSSDVEISVDALPLEGLVEWAADLLGCDGTYGPFSITDASLSARTTFTMRPSVIFQIPRGAQLSLQAKADVALQKDEYALDGGTTCPIEFPLFRQIECTADGCG